MRFGDVVEAVFLQPLDGFGSASICHIHDIIDMIAHRDEQVKEQFPPKLHLHLHRSATLERLPAAND